MTVEESEKLATDLWRKIIDGNMAYAKIMIAQLVQFEANRSWEAAVQMCAGYCLDRPHESPAVLGELMSGLAQMYEASGNAASD